MENTVYDVCKKVFNTEEITIIERLLGGRSNYTYLILVNDVKYTFRIPGKNGNLFVDRNLELVNLNQVDELGINNELVYFDEVSGIKISKFIDGSTFSRDDLESRVDELVSVMKKVHSSPLLKNDYEPINRIHKYEGMCIDLGYKHCSEYKELIKLFMELYENLGDINLVACHNDTQLSNFINASDGKIYLTDWEFAGNNDLYYDLACTADLNIDDAIFVTKKYFENASNSDIARVLTWRMFQTLQWHNVATYKDLIGLSEDLKIDFDFVAKKYLATARQIYDLLKTYEN